MGPSLVIRFFRKIKGTTNEALGRKDSFQKTSAESLKD
jgi:hypothetical protein